jgi:hypothetical protein
MNGTIEQYQRTAIAVAQITGNVLTQRPGTDPAAVRQWLLTKTATGDVWLFAELDDQRIPKFEPYEQATHHLSSSLKGMPVLVSNHTGIRLAFLLSPVRKLPKRIELPEQIAAGRVMIGQCANGRLAGAKWGELNHMMVAGMTGSGKSYTLREIVYQAIRQDFNLILGDLDNNTFPMLAGHPALLIGLAENENGFIDALRRAYAEIEHRKALYTTAANFPENIEEYNRWALKAGQEPLKRVLVVLDEFNSAVDNSGGVNGSLANLAKQIVWRGRKFGIQLVMGSQDFSAELMGKIRDQVGVMIVHRVKNASVAQNIGMAAAAKINPNRPGRALTDRWGLIQAFFLDKDKLIVDGQVVELLTTDERGYAERALRETEGKISRDVLTGWGMGLQEILRLQDAWALKGWAAKDPQRANGFYITPKLVNLLNNRTTQTTPNNPQTTQTTGQTTRTTDNDILLGVNPSAKTPQGEGATA